MTADYLGQKQDCIDLQMAADCTWITISRLVLMTLYDLAPSPKTELGNDREPLLTSSEADSAVRTPTHLVVPLTRLNATQASDTQGPSQLVILVTDPLGVLPSLSKITREQCLAWFILGYGNHLGPLEERQAEIDIRFTSGFMDTLLQESR